MYRIKIYDFGESKEYEIGYAGQYGAKGEKRAPRKKATPEQIEKQNQAIRVKKVRRLIKANFSPGDYWITLKYPKGTRKPEEKYREDLTKLFKKCRSVWKRRGGEFKFICRIEIGKRGGVHIHLLCNRLEPVTGQPDTAAVLQELWEHGRINYQLLHDYNSDGYQLLAEYIVKPLPEETGQYNLFEEEPSTGFKRYTTSRNLIRPEPVVKEYKRRTVRDIVQNGPRATAGYIIDKSSIRSGVNPYTGLSYCHYTEYRARTPKRNC